MSHTTISEMRPTSQSELIECYEESICTPGSIQPHGVLLVLKESDLTIIQASANTDTIIGIQPHDLLGNTLDLVVDSLQIDYLKGCLAHENMQDVSPCNLTLEVRGRAQAFEGSIHRVDGVLVLDLEPASPEDNTSFSSVYRLVRQSVGRFQNILGLKKLCSLAARELQVLTGFDRVMIYSFDQEWNGAVIAEERAEGVESFVGLHFPAGDIPEQARKLFALNGVRVIEDVNYEPVALIPTDNPLTGLPLDLSRSALRSVSPIHVEYLQNMNVSASMTLVLTRNGKLWGLIACHHRSPRRVPYEIRVACRFITQVLSLELAVKEDGEDYAYRMQLKSAQAKFMEYMSREENFTDGLINYKPNLLSPLDARGVVLYFNGQCTRLGETPQEDQIKGLVKWLNLHSCDEVFCTNSLPQLYPKAADFKDVASGLLAVSISRTQENYVMWFRPEVLQTVNWGGDPNHLVELDKNGLRLHPRRSFALWKEIVTMKSLAWKPCEINAAVELRSAIVVIVLRKADELAKTNAEMKVALNKEQELGELKSRFISMASHEFRTPLSTILASAELLENYNHKLSEEKKTKCFRRIGVAVKVITRLLEDVLVISQEEAGKLECNPTRLDLGNLCGELVEEVRLGAGNGHVILFSHRGDTDAWMDERLMQHILSNLLSNAVKYSPKGSIVRFELDCADGQAVFEIADQGIGIPSEDLPHLFELFHRASNVGNIAGTGLGLAIVKRSVELHRGVLVVESEIGVGTTFTVTLPTLQSTEAK